MKKIVIGIVGLGFVILAACGIMAVVSSGGEDDPVTAYSVPTPALQKTPAAKKASTRPNTVHEGVWSVGEDIKPGRYRTVNVLPEGATCYWQVSSDSEGQDIKANDIPTGGRPAVTLVAGQWFNTRGCGDWVKY